jgi:hypothetical protein
MSAPCCDSHSQRASPPPFQSEVAYEYFKDEFALSTQAAYLPGEQVYISYGPQANDSLLQYYGFVLRVRRTACSRWGALQDEVHVSG